MKQTVSLYMMEQAFRSMERSLSFSYDGLKILHEGIEQMEEDTGTEIEFDVIALCCDFAELPYSEAAEQYDIDVSACDDRERRETVIEYLNDNTWVLGANDDIVVFQQF